MSSEEMEAINKEHEGILLVQSSGTDSHMWSGQTTVRFLEQMTRELRRQRRKIGCNDTSAKAMLICDRCTSHLSRTYVDLRRQWAREQNVLLVGSEPDAEVQIPGGWGLSSSPNDAWHGHWHMLRMAYMRCSLGMPLNPLFKKDIQEFDIAPRGSLPSISCSLSTSIAADAFALVKLGTIAQGKTITWAWMSRGFLSRSTAATWHFNGDEIMLEEHMKKVNGLYRNLLNMKKLPTLDNRASTQLVSVFP